MASEAEPLHDCPRCPRLVAFRQANRAAHPDWFNAPAPSFGPQDARLLVLGLAPGLLGANRTGRPFTGDHAGVLLYGTLLKFGFARGRYEARTDDGLALVDCMISNAVRCVPPQNKPTGSEIGTCRRFLRGRLDALPRLKAIVALGRIAHDSAVVAAGLKPRNFAFAHGAQHRFGDGLTLFDSFHCSRLNTNTGRLTPEMFEAIFSAVRDYLDE